MADAGSVNVSTKISARVAKLLVREGDRVQAGQLLFELDSPEVATRQTQAMAVLDAARAQAGKAEQGTRAEEISAAQANWRRAVAGAELSRSTWRSTRQSSGYDVKSFEVRVRPLQRIDGFRPGMSVLFAWPPANQAAQQAGRR